MTDEIVIDIHNKKYKTKSGLDVTFITDKGRKNWPILGYIGSSETPTCWRSNGHRYYGEHGRCLEDLVEYIEPKVLRCWVNFYENGSVAHFRTKELADRNNAILGHKYSEADKGFKRCEPILRIGEAVEVSIQVPQQNEQKKNEYVAWDSKEEE